MAAVITSSSAVRPVNNGDTVRVVLEGEATEVGRDMFRLHSNVVQPMAAHVKSVEVIKPAKPKVGDVIQKRAKLCYLPIGSVVTNRYNDTLVILRDFATYGVDLNGSRDGDLLRLEHGDDQPPYTIRYIPE